MPDLRDIPSIDALCQRPRASAMIEQHGRRATVEALRVAADAVRSALTKGGTFDDVATAIEEAAAAVLAREYGASLRPVINATGVIVHTNLGRAPLSPEAAARVTQIATGYSNLEYDVAAGRRGRRDVHAERLICWITGAEAACVVNNNAAATLIALAALAAGREVIVSRGELVEIGGGFRVPDVMAQSGAVLREVGTTNRTRASDYAAAINDRTALLLRVHPSNFRIEGFTERPALAELVELGRRFDLPVVEDLGSGYLGGDVAELRDEPIVAHSIGDGAAVVMFSGDKLLGGPQAGIIAGVRSHLDSIRRHPLMRALRVDKMVYAALEATLQAYAGDRPYDIPVMRMIATPVEEVARRAQKIVDALQAQRLRATLVDGVSMIGGGSAPGAELPTKLLQLDHPDFGATSLDERLRQLDPPIIGRIENDRVLLDLRSVLPDDDERLVQLLTLAARAD